MSLCFEHYIHAHKLFNPTDIGLKRHKGWWLCWVRVWWVYEAEGRKGGWQALNFEVDGARYGALGVLVCCIHHGKFTIIECPRGREVLQRGVDEEKSSQILNYIYSTHTHFVFTFCLIHLCGLKNHFNLFSGSPDFRHSPASWQFHPPIVSTCKQFMRKSQTWQKEWKKLIEGVYLWLKRFFNKWWKFHLITKTPTLPTL